MIEIPATVLLISASGAGVMSLVKMALGAGGDVNAGNENGFPSLMLAAENGHCDIAKLLLQHKAEPDQPVVNGITPLMLAGQNGHYDAVALLLEHGADANAADVEGCTALISSAQNGHCDIVKMLIAYGADIDQASGIERTALMQASMGGHCDVVKFLLDHEANADQMDMDGDTALIEASREGYYDVAKLLLEHTSNTDQPNIDGDTPLILASHDGHCDVVALLLEHGADVNTVNVKGVTALVSAAQKGHCDVVKLLLVYGAEIDRETYNGRTALMQASLNGHCDVVTLLLEHKAKTDHMHIDVDAPLIAASQSDHCDIVKELPEYRANLNEDEGDDDGETPWIEACLRSHHDMVQSVMDHRANTDHLNVKRSTPLVLACLNGHYAVVEKLMGGGDVNAANGWGETALLSAARMGYCSVVKLLLEYGANTDQPNADGNTPLMEASLKGHCDVVSLILEAGANVNAADGTKGTALMSAAHNGHCAVVQLLLDSGANVDQANHNGRTTLLQASHQGHSEVVKILLKHKASIDQADVDCNTPLIMASHNGHCDVVALLLKVGGDVNAADLRGWTALMSAAQNGHCDVVKLLLEAGADVNAGAMHYWTRCAITGQLLYVDIEDTRHVMTQGQGFTPLLIACQSHHWDIANVLLDAGADVLHSDDIGENALMYINQGMLPGMCQRQQWVRDQLKRKILPSETLVHLIDCSPFGTTPLSDLLMASLAYNQSFSHEILLQGTVPDNTMGSYLYGLLPDRSFNSIKSVGCVLPPPYTGIEGKIALHTVGTAIACKAPKEIMRLNFAQSKARLTNMLGQTPLHLLAMENHCISRTWMVERISAMIEQGYAFSDCDINGRTCHHIACICMNAQFLLCAIRLDNDIIHNINIPDNVSQRAISYIDQYWRKTPMCSLAQLCSNVIRKSVLQHLGEVSQTQMFSMVERVTCVHSALDKSSHQFVHDMDADMLMDMLLETSQQSFDNSKITRIFLDRAEGVVRLEDNPEEQYIITVLGLLRCIGLEMQKNDRLFECIPLLKGSVREHTKCCALDEMDVSMILVNFTEQFIINLTENKYFGLQGRVKKKPSCSMQCNFHSVQFCCKFWWHFLQAIQGDAVKSFLWQNSIAIDSCHRKHGFNGTMYVTCGSLDNTSERQPEARCIAVDVAPVVQVRDYMCLLHVRHYDNQQVDPAFPASFEISSSQMDWNLIQYVPQEVLCGYTMVKLLRSIPKTFQSDSSKRTFTANAVLPSYMVKTSLLWVLDPNDKFREQYKKTEKDEIFLYEAKSTYKDDVLHLCRRLIAHSRFCNVVDTRHNGSISCLSADDITQVQEIADKCSSSDLDLSGKERIIPYVLVTQRNAAHQSTQNGINMEQVWEKVHQRLAQQGIPGVNTADEVTYNRGYYCKSGRNEIMDNNPTSGGRYPECMADDLNPERGCYPDISLEMARKSRVWALRALRLIVLLLKQEEDLVNYYLPSQGVPAKDNDLTIGLCEVFIALLE